MDLKALAIERLKQLGFQTSAEDGVQIEYCAGKVKEQLHNELNSKTTTEELPNELTYVAIERTVGEFLYTLMVFGGDSAKARLANLDLSTAITSLREGDVSISFDKDASPEARLMSVLDKMRRYGAGRAAIYGHRKMRWRA